MVSEKDPNENAVDVLIRRFKGGDEEVLYEKIKSAADLATDSLDGNTNLERFSVSGLPVPNCSVEDRLRPLNPFYVDKTTIKKKFVPEIYTTPSESPIEPTPSEKAMADARQLRENRAAVKKATKPLMSAVKKNSSEKAMKRHTSKMPPSYNSFIAAKTLQMKSPACI